MLIDWDNRMKSHDEWDFDIRNSKEVDGKENSRSRVWYETGDINYSEKEK